MEEGNEARFARHRSNAELLWNGLEELGIPPFVEEDHRLATLTTARLPDNINEAAIRQKLLDDYNIEIAGGFGPLAGRVWRIGLMGYSSQSVNVLTLLAALKTLL
jgi:alanine-glyoxylate transaminase/serine-glyoxylate transaminase/serine-pyruvate transaminase